MVCVFVVFLFSLNSPHSCYEIKQDVFFVPGATFLSVYHYFELCVMLCHAMEMYSVQVRTLVCDVLCDGCGRSFSVLACESGLHFKIHV